MKIFKLFISLSLILSISLLNSFAAISVSDGSAFVTKAEFAADLNNLSNRMSSLENSLDAKIDSLVSSYLSRNGIWNGEKQNKIALSVNMGTGIAFSNSDHNNKIYPMVLNQKLVKLSKSGLVKLELSRGSRLIAEQSVISPPYNNATGGLLSINLFFNNKEVKNLKEGTWYSATDENTNYLLNGNLSSWKFSDMLENRYSQTGAAAYWGRPAFKEYVYFFANKDDDIYSNVAGMGSLYGQLLRNVTINWYGTSTLSYSVEVY